MFEKLSSVYNEIKELEKLVNLITEKKLKNMIIEKIKSLENKIENIDYI